MANYLFKCKEHGEITLHLLMSEVKEKMPCPLCEKEMERIYSPIENVWKCDGAYGKKSN